MPHKHNLGHYFLTILASLAKAVASAIFWIILGVLGIVILEKAPSPIRFIAGLPAVLISAGFVLNALGSVLLSIFSPAYNKDVCPLCTG